MKAKRHLIFLLTFFSCLQVSTEKSVLATPQRKLVPFGREATNSIQLTRQDKNFQFKIAKFPKLAQELPTELEILEQRIRTNPKDAEAFLRRGVIYAYGEEYQKAITDYNQAIHLEPENAEAYNYRGTAYYRLENYQQALEDYNQAIYLNPELALAYYNRAYVRQKLEDLQGAIEDFQQGADLSLKQGDTNSYQQALEIIKELKKEE